jgi:hypothetical protein
MVVWEVGHVGAIIGIDSEPGMEKCSDGALLFVVGSGSDREILPKTLRRRRPVQGPMGAKYGYVNSKFHRRAVPVDQFDALRIPEYNRIAVI